jgi:hypothetical protein
MDFDLWGDGFAVITASPAVVGGLVTAAAGALKSAISSGEVKGSMRRSEI